jgi:hypothetical protein
MSNEDVNIDDLTEFVGYKKAKEILSKENKNNESEDK